MIVLPNTLKHFFDIFKNWNIWQGVCKWKFQPMCNAVYLHNVRNFLFKQAINTTYFSKHNICSICSQGHCLLFPIPKHLCHSSFHSCFDSRCFAVFTSLQPHKWIFYLTFNQMTCINIFYLTYSNITCTVCHYTYELWWLKLAWKFML